MQNEVKLLEHWVGSHRLQDKVVAELLEDALYEDIYTVSGYTILELLNFYAVHGELIPQFWNADTAATL